MPKKSKMEELVQSILTSNPQTRDDDALLYVQVARCIGLDTTDIYSTLKHLPYETVSRCRRRVQEYNVGLRGDKYQQRKLKQEELRRQYTKTYWQKMRFLVE